MRITLLVLTLLGARASAGIGQAPDAAGMWRVATATLAEPAALSAGPAATFWNPAPASETGGTWVGGQVIQTPDVVGLSGVLAGVTHRIGAHLQLGLLFGRVDIRDLVRTTTSPLATMGDIPVYEQFGGVSVGAVGGIVSGAVAVRGHDARFDATREQGLTTDIGLRLRPHPRLAVAAATHLVPATFSRHNTTDYFGAAEYLISAKPVFGAPATVVGRYGAVHRDRGGVEHAFGLGLTLDSAFTLDAVSAREAAYGHAEWRLGLAVGLRVGRYAITVARGGGVNGLGATYRIGLDVELAR